MRTDLGIQPRNTTLVGVLDVQYPGPFSVDALAAEQLVKDQARREQVALSADHPVKRLGCHVGDRANDRRRHDPSLHDPRNPKVRQENVSVRGDHDVLRLDVTMHDVGLGAAPPVAVGDDQRTEEAPHDVYDEPFTEPTPLHKRAKVDPVDVVHHQEGQFTRGIEVVDGGKAWVPAELRGDLGLPREHLAVPVIPAQ